MHPHPRLIFGLGRRALLAALLALSPAAPSAVAQTACAVADPANAHMRVLPPACGVAVLPVTAEQRRDAKLAVAVRSGQAYVRSLRLTYGSGNSPNPQQAEMRLHRLYLEGESTGSFPTAINGLGLTAVAIDIMPRPNGGDPVALALTGTSSSEAAAPPYAAANSVTTGALPAQATSTASLDPSEWALIGSSTAHLSQARDTIPIGRTKGRFDRLVLSSRGSQLPVQSVVVQPVEGPAFAVSLGATLTPGTLSIPIVIEPADFIRDVTVTYSTVGSQGRQPTVEIRGRYAENWQGKIGENRQFAGGWVLLGTVDVVVSPHANSKRSGFRVPGQEGPFKRLKFVSRRGAIDLANVVVDAPGGRSDTLAVNTVLLPDTESPALPFSSGPQSISSLTLSPRLHSQSRIDATIEVWAQY